MTFSRQTGLAIVLAAGLCVGGCGPGGGFFKTNKYKFLSAEEVVESGNIVGTPINPILPSVGVMDSATDVIPNAEFPQPQDYTYSRKDYVMGAGDVLQITIMDLFQEGVETPLERLVSESGYVDLPLVGRVYADGLTSQQLKEAIVDAYYPQILRNPVISVEVTGRRQNTFSIDGAVQRAGTYNVIRPDMRLMHAMALAGGVTQPTIKYVYVIREEKKLLPTGFGQLDVGQPQAPAQGQPGPIPSKPTPQGPPTQAAPGEGLYLPPALVPPPEGGAAAAEAPRQQAQPSLQLLPGEQPTRRTVPQTQPGQSAEDRLRELERLIPGEPKPALPDNFEQPRPGDVGQMADLGDGVGVTAIVAVDQSRQEQPGETLPVQKPVAKPGSESDPFGWAGLNETPTTRVIAINFEELTRGNERMDIVIHDNDIIYVPFLEVGEFYMAGAVLRPGPYSLTGRKVTIKEALSAAGNMGPLAWPENALLIRRVGDNQEQMIPIDIQAIYLGQEPDIFLKPDDIVAVGTDVRSIFWAVLRNAFRMTYGFGFVYDRNFSDPLFVTPTSKRFTRL